MRCYFHYFLWPFSRFLAHLLNTDTQRPQTAQIRLIVLDFPSHEPCSAPENSQIAREGLQVHVALHGTLDMAAHLSHSLVTSSLRPNPSDITTFHQSDTGMPQMHA
jgi:hypothetical protein